MSLTSYRAAPPRDTSAIVPSSTRPLARVAGCHFGGRSHHARTSQMQARILICFDAVRIAQSRAIKRGKSGRLIGPCSAKLPAVIGAPRQHSPGTPWAPLAYQGRRVAGSDWLNARVADRRPRACRRLAGAIGCAGPRQRFGFGVETWLAFTGCAGSERREPGSVTCGGSAAGTDIAWPRSIQVSDRRSGCNPPPLCNNAGTELPWRVARAGIR
mgnify:FL=1